MIKKTAREEVRQAKHRRVRKKVHGSAEKPRLAVFRSSKHIYAQVINDETGCTLVSASSLEPELKTKIAVCGTKEAAKAIGEAVAQRALSRGISTVVFDRGGYIYHGRVAAVAEGARNAGLDF